MPSQWWQPVTKESEAWTGQRPNELSHILLNRCYVHSPPHRIRPGQSYALDECLSIAPTAVRAPAQRMRTQTWFDKYWHDKINIIFRSLCLHNWRPRIHKLPKRKSFCRALPSAKTNTRSKLRLEFYEATGTYALTLKFVRLGQQPTSFRSFLMSENSVPNNRTKSLRITTSTLTSDNACPILGQQLRDHSFPWMSNEILFEGASGRYAKV